MWHLRRFFCRNVGLSDTPENQQQIFPLVTNPVGIQTNTNTNVNANTHADR